MKKMLVAMLLTVTLLMTMVACNNTEEPSDIQFPQGNETTSSAIGEEENVQSDAGNGEESVSEEIKEGDDYALYWLRAQDFSAEPLAQKETLPLFGEMESNFGLGGENFSGWLVEFGFTDDWEQIYCSLDELIMNVEETVKAGDDDYYQIVREDNQRINFNVHFVNLSEEELSLKQIYENGWWYIGISHSLDSKDYPYDNSLFEITGYTPVEMGEGKRLAQEYVWMDDFVSTMGAPNFLSFSAKSSTVSWYSPTVDEALGLMTESEVDEASMMYYGALAYKIGWVDEEYVILLYVEDSSQDANGSFEVTNMYYVPASAFEWISYDNIAETSATDCIQAGPNVLPEWNERMQNGDIIKSEYEM